MISLWVGKEMASPPTLSKSFLAYSCCKNLLSSCQVYREELFVVKEKAHRNPAAELGRE